MKRLILVLALAATALSGCAQLKEWYHDAEAQSHAGASGIEEQRPYPKSSSDLGLGI
jgi:hypothetical protein